MRIRLFCITPDALFFRYKAVNIPYPFTAIDFSICTSHNLLLIFFHQPAQTGIDRMDLLQ